MPKVPLSHPSLPCRESGTKRLNLLDKMYRSGKAEIQTQHPGSTQSTLLHTPVHTHTHTHTHTHKTLHSVTRSFQFLGNSQKRNLLPSDWVSGVPTPLPVPPSLPSLHPSQRQICIPGHVAAAAGSCRLSSCHGDGLCSYQQSRLLAAKLAHSYHA